jgi:type I restriction enzyme S subunit
MDAQQFLAEFGHIANAPGGVARLREMIYQLAITGTLTAQSESDGDARALLADISAHREHLIGEKKYKRLPKLESAALAIPKGMTLPASWCWTRLLDLGEISPRNEAKDEAPASFIPMSGIPQLHMGKLALESSKWGEIKKGFTHFANGDVVVAKITPCFENGKAAIIEGLAHTIGAGTTELHVYRPIHSGILSGYAYLFLRSPYFAIEGERNMTGTAGQKRLPTEYFATRAMPLPPTEEQSRIVAKVDELMALCDKLEAQQKARRKLQNNLRQSTLQAVATANSPHELQITWTRLADNFGWLFYAPEDVAGFKGLILDLAMSGLLLNIEHRHASTGAELIDAIAARRIAWSKDCVDQEQKEVLAMLKKLRIQQAPTPELALPEHWVWSSLLQVSQVIIDCDHKTPSYSATGIHLIRTTDIRDGEMRLHSTKKVSQESYLARSRRLVPSPGDIFFTREAPMGEAAIVPNGLPVCLGQRLMLVRLFGDLFNNRFLIYAIRSPGFQSRLQSSAIGMTVKHINVGDVENLMIPVPPRIEQDRIVAIVDGLFHLCDHYADQLTRKQRTATNLVSSAVSNLTGITTEQKEETMKAPQTELIAPLRLGKAPDIKAQPPLATILARHNGEMPAKDLWQRFGGEIDTFYAQLKTEVAHGWIREPAVAEMREKRVESADA